MRGDVFDATGKRSLTVPTGSGGGGGGEANTASNQGTGGVGFFLAKVGVDLQFKNARAASSKITVVNNPGLQDVDFDVGVLAESDITNLVADLAALTPQSRNINTTAPLTGGGDLSADRTLGITDFGASGGGHARGAVPDPGGSAGTAKFLREDATWAVPPGGSGTTGPQGPPGEEGPEGPIGPQGPQGPAGATGTNGADGAQGAAGPPGQPGEDGAEGAMGPVGPMGATGAQGSTGATGAQGIAGPAIWPAMPDELPDYYPSGPLMGQIVMGGDVAVTGPPDGLTATIQPNSVGFSKQGQINTQRLVGRTTAGTGNQETLTVVAPLALPSNSGTLTTSVATGTVTGRSTAGTGVMEQLTPDSTLSITAGAIGVAAASLTGRYKSFQFFSGASGTYTTPAGVTQLWVFMLGAGGGGGGAAQTAAQSAAGGGGGSGAFCFKIITSPSATYAYDSKAGGAGGAAGNNNGTGGATSTFGASFLSAPGGGAGAGSPASATAQIIAGGAGAAIATGGDMNCPGQGGTFGMTNGATAGISGLGGPAIGFGGGGAMAAKVAEGGGAASTGYGAGGTGGLCLGTTARVGGAGAPGYILVLEFS